MRRAPTIKLDIPVRKELERLSRSRSVAVRLAERSRIVLLAAGGLDNQEIAAKLDITRQKAGRWRDRFVEDGLGGIEKDASRSGRIPSIGRRKLLGHSEWSLPFLLCFFLHFLFLALHYFPHAPLELLQGPFRRHLLRKFQNPKPFIWI